MRPLHLSLAWVVVTLALTLTHYPTSTHALVLPTKHPRVQQMLARAGDYPAYWFTQNLDHFNPEETRTFQQRYYVNSQYWDKQWGPVFLYINGEGPVYGPPSSSDDEVVLLAQKFNGLIVTLEHRYYGASTPFADLSTKNLQYLSSKQALFDLAHFIVNYTSSLPLTNPDVQRVFTIGGSYSGALSAWFRLKFPHITTGSIASSGVVNAILDFTEFDQQVAESAGTECANALRATTHAAEQIVQQGGSAKDQLKAMFSASTLTDDGDFFYFMADSMAEGVQYGFQDAMCVPLVAAVHKNQSLLQVYANYTQNVWGKNLGSPAEYATSWQQNTTADVGKADRQWWFQTCSELGYFQNAPATGSIRSAMYVNMDYHKSHCQNVFGMPLWPNTEETNEYYGGNHTAATKVVFVNGSQDPWQRASVMSNLSHWEPAMYISCHNCGHCVDLRGCPGGCDKPNNLAEMRAAIQVLVGTWLND